MRSGRPAYHIKAHFVSFFDVHNRTMVYFELDNKGNLKKNENGQFTSHMQNSYVPNSNLILKTNEVPINPKSAISETDIKSSSKEIENAVEESPPNNELESNFNDETFTTFEDDFDIFNSYPINDTDIFLQDDNIFNYSENQLLNII